VLTAQNEQALKHDFKECASCPTMVVVPAGTKDGDNRGAARNTIDVHRRKAALIMMGVPERKLLAASAAQKVSSMSRISSLPGLTVVPNWSMRAAHSRAASVLRSQGGRWSIARPALRRSVDRSFIRGS
jgi:hypothetical protein